MSNTYISCFDYLRSSTGVETASLLGNTARLSSGYAAGVTSLGVTPALTVALNANDIITIFDGASSETVFVASTTAIGATAIPLLVATQFAHAQNTPLCSDGLMGSLGYEIQTASEWAENIAQQSFWSAIYTLESLKAPSMRASIDNQGILNFRTRHFPVTVISGLALRSNTTASNSYDPAQAFIDPSGMVVSVPLLNLVSGAGSFSLYNAPARSQTLWIQISYTAGFTSLPKGIADAVTLLTSDILTRRNNPSGVQEQHLGKKIIKVGIPTDQSGDSLLVKRATQLLQNYSVEVS